MQSSDKSTRPADTADLEFPDWSGMDRFTPRLSAKAALRRNEDYQRRYKATPGDAERRYREKCPVEFVL